jgi:hypothetical protein
MPEILGDLAHGHDALDHVHGRAVAQHERAHVIEPGPRNRSGERRLSDRFQRFPCKFDHEICQSGFSGFLECGGALSVISIVARPLLRRHRQAGSGRGRNRPGPRSVRGSRLPGRPSSRPRVIRSVLSNASGRSARERFDSAKMVTRNSSRLDRSSPVQNPMISTIAPRSLWLRRLQRVWSNRSFAAWRWACDKASSVACIVPDACRPGWFGDRNGLSERDQLAWSARGRDQDFATP